MERLPTCVLVWVSFRFCFKDSRRVPFCCMDNVLGSMIILLSRIVILYLRHDNYCLMKVKPAYV